MKIKYDKKLLVAMGKSRMAKSWQNKEILWSELLDKLSTTTRTRETVAEYAAMTKDDKNRCKDVGGFVAGYLKGGKRNNASVVNRCAVCLDADYADPGLLDDLDMTFINAYALYSTHSHTPEQMRLCCGIQYIDQLHGNPEPFHHAQGLLATVVTVDVGDDFKGNAAFIYKGIAEVHGGIGDMRQGAGPLEPLRSAWRKKDG